MFPHAGFEVDSSSHILTRLEDSSIKKSKLASSSGIPNGVERCCSLSAFCAN